MPKVLQQAMQGFLLVIVQRMLADAEAGKGYPLLEVALDGLDREFLRSLPPTEVDEDTIAALNKLCFRAIDKVRTC